MLVSGFLSYDEALQYARKLHTSAELAQLLRHCHIIIISPAHRPSHTRVSRWARGSMGLRADMA